MSKTQKPHIESVLVEDIRRWLGASGIQFFKNLKKDYGTFAPVLSSGSMPHPVHFREGMAVRNKIRELTNSSWTTHQYDDYWTVVIEKAVEV